MLLINKPMIVGNRYQNKYEIIGNEIFWHL